MVTNNLGLALDAQGRGSEAEAAWRRALEIWERRLPPDHPDLGRVLHALGDHLRKRGELEEARALLERASTIHRAGDDDATDRADIERALAEVEALLADRSR